MFLTFAPVSAHLKYHEVSTKMAESQVRRLVQRLKCLSRLIIKSVTSKARIRSFKDLNRSSRPSDKGDGGGGGQYSRSQASVRSKNGGVGPPTPSPGSAPDFVSTQEQKTEQHLGPILGFSLKKKKTPIFEKDKLQFPKIKPRFSKKQTPIFKKTNSDFQKN